MSFAAFTVPAYGQDRVYNGPGADWTSASNWNGNDAPDAGGEIAVFQNNGAPTNISITGAVSINGLRFEANAPARTINLGSGLNLSGTGVSNQSGTVQTININGADASTTTLQMIGTTDFTGTQTDVRVGNGFFQIFQQANATSAHAILNGGFLALETTDGTVTLGALSGTGTVAAFTNNGGLATQQLTVGGLNLTTTFSGQLAANIGTTINLVKVGTGTLTLAGANTYVGTTTISAGTLQIGNGGTSGTLGNGDVVNNATLAFDRTGTLTVNGAISGTGNVIQAGPGATILSGANSYSGTTNIQAGTLVAANASALGTIAGGTIVQSGASLQVQGGLAVANEALTINGTGQANGGALRGGTGTNGYSGVITLGSDSRINADGGFNITNAVNGGGNGLTVGGAGGVYFSAGINGISSLTKDGTGIAVMYGANSYTGPTTVNAGTLQLDSGSAIGDGSTVVVTGSGILRVSTSETIGSLSGNGSLILQSGAMLTTGGDNSSTIFSGNSIEQIGAGRLTKVGTGTLTLTGTNSYTGATTISAGTLQIGNGGASGTLGTGNIVNNAVLVIDRSGTLALGNLISGSGTVTQSGSGTLRLTNAGNNYGGGTVIESGTVEIGADGALGTGGVQFTGTGTLGTTAGVSATVNNLGISGGAVATVGAATGQTLTLTGALQMAATAGTSLRFGSATQTGTVAANFTSLGFIPNAGSIAIDGGILKQNSSLAIFFLNANGGMSIASGATYDINGSTGAGVNLTGAGTIANGVAGAAQFQALQTATSTFAGSIANGVGATSLLVRGGGRLILTGTNSYSGPTIFNGNSTLQVGNGGTTGSLGTGLLSLDNGQLVFDRSDTLTAANRVTGNGTLRQSGLGTTVLTGNNIAGQAFTGAVFVDSGRLAIDGNFGDVTGNSTQLVVGAAGALGGSGTFFGNVDAQNGTLAPGNSPGTLTIAGNLTLGAGTILNFELGEAGTVGGPDNDLVNVGGNLILDGTLNTFAATPAYGPGYYRLFNYGGTLTDNGLLIGSIAGGFTPTVLTNIDGQVNLLLGDGAGQIVQYWDGADTTGASGAANGNGGAGVWNAGGTNWTTPTGYAVNDRWQRQVGIFGGAAGGTVSIGGTQSFQELRFVTEGYTLAGSGGLATTGGFSVIDVDNGLGAAIGVTISGAGGLTKTGAGALTLNGANSYAGVTTVSEGTLALSSTGSLAGNVMNSATFNNAGTVAGRVTNNATLISTGILAGGLVNNGNASVQNRVEGDVSNMAGTITLTGATGGIARFDQLAGATFDLAGFSTAIGALNGAGTVQLGSNAGSALAVGDASSSSFAGTIAGAGGLAKAGNGTLTLAGANSYTGTTRVDAGTLALAATGSLASDVVNSAIFSNAGTVAGVVTNNGTFTSTGILAGGLVNNGAASLQNRVEGYVSNLAGTITLTGATGGIARFDQLAGATFDLAGFSTAIGALHGAGTVQLGSNAGSALTVGDASSSSFAGTIAGAGGLAKAGNGTLTLAGANSYTGTTRVDAGTLALAATGSLASDVVNSAIFSNAGTVAGRVTNNATLNSIGILAGGLVNHGTTAVQNRVEGDVSNLAGTITLTGATGGIARFDQLAGAAFDLAGFSTAIGALNGAGTVQLGSNAASILTIGDASSTLYAGTIAGAGGLTKVGSGMLTLTGANSYSGVTTIDAGTLALTSTGSLAGDVENNATFNNAGTVTGMVRNAGNLASTGILAGGLVNSGTASLQNRVEGNVSNIAGTITLTGATGGITRLDQAAGATFDLAGFSNSLGVLSGAGTIQLGSDAASALTVGDASSSLFAGTIAGSGRLVKAGAGTLTLSGANSYSGGTLISAGALRLGDGGTSGSISGPIEVNGTLIIDRSDSFALTNALSGTGGLVQAGSGTTVLSGANGLTGGFTVSNGRLRGDTVAFGANNIRADGTIEFAQAAAGSYAGQISGGGVFEKTGAGRLTLTGTSGFTGQTRLLGGVLSVNGSLARSALSVGAGSRLSGNGTVGAVTVASGGTIAPGNSIGTLNVNGDITFAAGAIYEVEVDPAGTATDLIAATGRAILNGGSVVHIGLNGNYRSQTTYTILTAAGGVQGTFADVSSSFAFLDPTLGYGANAVTLTLERNDIDFADVAATANQRSAATGVNQLGFGNPVFDTVLILDAAGARGTFDLLSGEIYASLQSALVQDSRFVRGAALDRMRHAGVAVDADPGLRFWMQGLGSRGHLDGDGNARRMKQDSAGVLLGVDAIADETVQLGAFGGYQQGGASVRAAASDADINSYHLGVYADTDLGALGIRVGYAFSWHQADVIRRIAFANFADTVTADYDASTAQAFAEIGYRLDFGAAQIEPFAQIARIWVDSERLGERGGAAALEVARAKMSTSVSTLGARLDQSFSLGSLNASLQLSAGWRHAFGDRLPMTMSSFGGSSPFAIAGAPIARDAFAADIGIDFALSERVRFGVAYSGDVARRAESHSGRATFSWMF